VTSRHQGAALALLSFIVLMFVTTRVRADETPIETSKTSETSETSASSDVLPASGMRVALRSGFAVPIGDAFDASGSLSDTIEGYVPMRLDIGYRVQRHFYVGAVGQLGMIVPKNCPSGGSCSGTDFRIGVMAAYHFLPARRLDPWLGLGMGFEILNVSRDLGTSSVDVSMRGIELVSAELGADLRAAGGLRLGPVVSTSIGRFTSITVNDTSTGDFDASVHAWVMVGLRGALDL
jgi:hypothetical protein